MLIMFHNKATTYGQMEKPKKEKKFKQNAYEEIRKLVDSNEVDEAVKEVAKLREDFFRSVKTKKKNKQENSYNFKLFD